MRIQNAFLPTISCSSLRAALGCTLMLAALSLLPVQTVSAAPKPDSARKAAVAELARAGAVVQGAGRRAVYVFFDANCAYCPLLYRNLQPLIKSHDLQLHWLPVAVVDATSLGKAAAILEADDPVAALDHNERQYDTAANTGAIEEKIPSARTEARVRANEALLARIAIPVVPTMVFVAKDGAVQTVQGALSPLALRRMFAHAW